MIAYLHKYFSNIPPVFIDGALYSLISFFMFSQSYLSGDEAAKYIEPEHKFWLLFFVGSIAAFLVSLKMFRSTSYAEHRIEKDLENK